MATEFAYKYTATGELGTQRETMLKNQLLLRSQVGKTFKRGFRVPGANFTYGRPYEQIDGGAALALCWKTHEPTPPPVFKLEKNIGGLNKAALDTGLVIEPDQYELRATTAMLLKENDGRNTQRIRRMPAGTLFGMPTRPSTPVFDLLEHRYQERWLEHRRSVENARRLKEETLKKKALGSRETRTSLLRSYQLPVEKNHLWQLPKFSRHATPTLKTFRSERCRTAAFHNNEYEGASRKGIYGHGVYASSSVN